MRRFFKVFCAALLISGTIFFHPNIAPAAVLTARGIFEGFEATKEGWVITLLVDEKKASGLLDLKCRYFRDNFEITREEFFDTGVGDLVIVELDEESGEISSCRIEPPRAM